MSFSEIKEFCSKVCEQIRWKQVRDEVAKELNDHICDQRDAYIKDGYGEDEATAMAIEQMGDPIEIGIRLDMVNKPQPQFLMMGFTFGFLALNLCLRLFMGISQGMSTFMLSAAIGTGAFAAAYMLDYTVLIKAGRKTFATLAIINLILIIAAVPIRGTYFINLGLLSFSMSYLSPVYILAAGVIIYKQKNKGYLGMGICIGAFTIFIFILMFSGWHLYGGYFLSIGVMALMEIAAYDDWFGIGRSSSAFIGLIPILGIVCSCYLKGDFSMLVDPFIRDIMKNAAFIGNGSVNNYVVAEDLYVFNTEYFLTYLTSAYGWIAFIAVVSLFAAFTVIGIYKCIKIKNEFGKFIAASGILSFGLQAVFYIVNNLGFCFVQSISLPLLSYGNGIMIINMAVIGITLSVFRSKHAGRYKTKKNVKTYNICK